MTAGLLDALEHAIAMATDRAEIREFEVLRDAHDLATELLAAAHASLTARDLADQLAADDRLRAALAACAPTDTGMSAVAPQRTPPLNHPPCPGCLESDCNGECMENL